MNLLRKHQFSCWLSIEPPKSDGYFTNIETRLTTIIYYQPLLDSY